MDIDNYRKEIDEIDRRLVSALDERMRTAEKIARYKMENDIPVTDYLREKQVIDKIIEMSEPDMAGYNKILFSNLMELSKDHQKKIAHVETEIAKKIRKALAQTPAQFPETTSVACQGVAGAYSHAAAEKMFKMPKVMFIRNFEGVFAAIKSGLCRYGILPLENSTAGSVNQIYDLMMEYNFHIVRSMRLQINHCLLAPNGVKKEDIKEIFSHPQAFMQCGKYISKFPNAKLTECENTAQAASLVSKSGRKDAAAIGSDENGRLYSLNCLEAGIQDYTNNYTRFICISKDLEIYPGADRTSVMMTLDHKPGALYGVLARLNAMSVNLEKLESRPLPGRDFEFMFYFDVRESVYSDAFPRLIDELAEMAREFRYLGSYVEV